MKEKIERFSRGEFEYEQPHLCLTEEELSLTMQAGKIHEGSFTVCNSASKMMRGIVYTSDRLMKLKEETFREATNTIIYQFDATNLKAGDEVHGQFHVISEYGELSLPFHIQIEALYCDSSMGRIKDLFQFTNLARVDWSDAKRVFKLEDFEKIFLSNDSKYQLVYRNLIKSLSTSQALENFLVTIRKKQEIHLEIDRLQVEYNISDEKCTDKLVLTKNQWGFAEIRVSTDAPFIQLEQKFLWADRFIENSHQITYRIDPVGLRHGNNFGHIYISTVHQTIIVSVLCRNRHKENKNPLHRHQSKIEFGLLETYLSFRVNRIKLSEYIEETEALIIGLPGPEVSYVRDLMKSHLAIISGHGKLAEELLSDFAKDEAILKKRSIPEYCAYLYLEAMFKKEESVIENNASIIRKYYANGYSDPRILWFLLYTDKRYEKNKSLKLADIREQYDMGCRSPILYYEAVSIFNEEPYLLRELNDFEIQTLNFGIKNWIISKETAKQYTYLSTKRKNFHPVVFSGLVKLYDEFDNYEILSAICGMLIKGMKREEKYFEWYKLGVEAQLRVTELYEYYMYSINDCMQDRIAQSVLMYFIYNSTLNDARKAFLYAAVIRAKDVNNTIYEAYYKKMELYALRMLKEHVINRDLAILYREILNKPVVSNEVYEHLPYVMYKQELVCDNKAVVSVTVIHKELGTEVNTPLTDGVAIVDLYTGNSEVFLIDAYGNRYADSVKYKLTPLLHSEEYESICLKHSNHPMLLLHMFDRYHNYRILNAYAIELRRNVLLIEGLTSEYAAYCHQTLIDYYYEVMNDELLEFYLEQLELSRVTPQERIKYIEIMLIRTFYHKALGALKAYGFEGIPINRLVRLCSAWMKTSAAESKDAFMVNLSFYVFSHNKYDEAILRYLVNYYEGTTGEMYQLWQAAQGFELECHNLEERLISQMLFTESNIDESFEVFHSYYKSVTNHLLVRATLTYYAYRYLVFDREPEQGLFQIMKRELFYEENDFCLLAWLKYYSMKDTLSDSELVFIEFNIHKLVRNEIVMPFFLNYKNRITLPDSMADKYIISRYAGTAKRVFIHYRLGSEGEFITERMHNCFMGIHTKEFLLFWHEELQYYITEEAGEITTETEKVKLQYDCETPRLIEEKYKHINRMLVSFESKEAEELLGLAEDYARKEYMISQCFQPIGRKGGI